MLKKLCLNKKNELDFFSEPCDTGIHLESSAIRYESKGKNSFFA